MADETVRSGETNPDLNEVMKDIGGGHHARAVAAVVAASENHIGQVGGHADVIEITLSLDTNAYAAGDVLAATQEAANAVRVNGGASLLQSVVVVDQDDQGVAFDLYVLSENVAMGAENSAPDISDADALKVLAVIPVSAADYRDLGGVKVAALANLGRVVKAAAGSRSLWLAAVNGAGTPTFTAAGLKLRLGMLQD